jgi:hypothetical protein
MNISAILPSSILNQIYNPQNTNQQQRTEFQQLTQALQSGNLITAQQAFSALTNGTTSSGTLQGARLSQDLKALGSALQSGNLTGARNAYSSVQQSLQNSTPMAAHHHRPHHGGGGSHLLTSGFPDTTSSSSSSVASQSDIFQPVNLTA